MDSFLLLLCKHDNNTVVIRVQSTTTYEDLLLNICQRWRHLNAHFVMLSYSLAGHSNCMLQNDEDLQNTFFFASNVGVKIVDVSVIDSSKVVAVYGAQLPSGIIQSSSMKSSNLPSTSMKSSNMQSSSMKSSNETAVDEEIDFVPSICSNKDKTLMIANWCDDISSVGQKFEGVEEFRRKLCRYAIGLGFEFKYLKNESNRVTAVCKYKKPIGCEWRIHARKDSGNGFFYIRSLTNVHTCDLNVGRKKNPRTTAAVVSQELLSQVRKKPHTRPIDVVQQFNTTYGLDVSYKAACKSVKKAQKEVYGDHSLSYDDLRWYIGSALSTNVGSHLLLEKDDQTRRFSRVFVSFYACIDGFNFCRPTLYLDGTHLEGHYKGMLLSATGRNGNQGIFPLAYAVVNSENEDNWSSFLLQLKVILDPFREVTFVSDCNEKLIEAMVKVFPSFPLAYCLTHLELNLKEKLKGRHKDVLDIMVSKLRECAYASTPLQFHRKLEELKREGGQQVIRFLEDLPNENWTNAYFKGKHYGEMYSHIAESFYSWIHEGHLPITSMIDTIRLKMMEMMAECRMEASKWIGVLCPEIEKRMDDEIKSGTSWIVTCSSEDEYEVISSPSIGVNIRTHQCSCYQWQMNGFPCSHAAAALMKSGKDPHDYCDSCFTKESFEKSYSKAINPIPTFGKPVVPRNEVVVLPPLCRKPLGRPKRIQCPSRGENILRPIKCSRCGKVGHHNKKSCKQAV